jgi:hypothetical protein
VSLVQSARPVYVNARFPWVLFVPLASVTELGGVLLLLSGDPIGWAAVAAPVIGFVVMRGPVRPRFEFYEDGVIFRKSAKSPMLPWNELSDVALVRASGRTVLAYRLMPGITALKRHPGGGFLRAKGLDFDGGFFVDQMTAEPAAILELFRSYLSRSGGGNVTQR